MWQHDNPRALVRSSPPAPPAAVRILVPESGPPPLPRIPDRRGPARPPAPRSPLGGWQIPVIVGAGALGMMLLVAVGLVVAARAGSPARPAADPPTALARSGEGSGPAVGSGRTSPAPSGPRAYHAEPARPAPEPRQPDPPVAEPRRAEPPPPAPAPSGPSAAQREELARAFEQKRQGLEALLQVELRGVGTTADQMLSQGYSVLEISAWQKSRIQELYRQYGEQLRQLELERRQALGQ